MMKIPRPIRFLVFLLLLAGIVALVIVGVRLFLSGTARTSLDGELTSVAIGEEVQRFGSGYIASDGIRIRCYNERGEMQWDDGAFSQKCEFTCSSTMVALWRENNLRLLDASGVMKYNKTQASTIELVRCGTQNAGIYMPGTEKELLVVNRDTGNVIDEISLSGETVLDFGFYTDQDSLWVLMLDSSGAMPITYLSLYKPGISHMGYCRFDQVVYKVIPYQGSLYAIGSRDLSVINANGELQTNTVLVHGWQYLDHVEAKENCIFLFGLTGEIGGNPTRLKMVQGDTSTEMHIPSGSLMAMITNKAVYGISSASVQAIPLDGSANQSYALPFEAEAAAGKLSQNRVLLQVGQEMRSISLP